MLDGVDPLGQYRPYCDRCGDRLCSSPLRLGQARLLAEGHARRTRHDVRIEPWDSFALVELVAAQELGGPFAGQPPTPPDRPTRSQHEDPRWQYRAGCSCRFCVEARAADR
jgi:hypothetical protein